MMSHNNGKNNCISQVNQVSLSNGHIWETGLKWWKSTLSTGRGTSFESFSDEEVRFIVIQIILNNYLINY